MRKKSLKLAQSKSSQLYSIHIYRLKCSKNRNPVSYVGKYLYASAKWLSPGSVILPSMLSKIFSAAHQMDMFGYILEVGETFSSHFISWWSFSKLLRECLCFGEFQEASATLTLLKILSIKWMRTLMASDEDKNPQMMRKASVLN